MKGHTYKNELVDDKSAIIVPFFLYKICFSESVFIAEDTIALGNPFVPLFICMNINCIEIFQKFIATCRRISGSMRPLQQRQDYLVCLSIEYLPHYILV